MVRNWKKISLFCLLLGYPGAGLKALFNQTQTDLDLGFRHLSDWISERDVTVFFPLVVVQTEPYWQESQSDFHTAVLTKLTQTFPTQTILDCDFCQLQVVNSDPQGTLTTRWNHIDTAAITAHYAQGKITPAALLYAQELPSGFSVKVIDASSEKVLYSHIADATQTLDLGPPAFSKYYQEYERRQRGEALAHTHIKMSLYQFSLLLEWLDQWGGFNQYMTGIGIFVSPPDMPLGLTLSQYYILNKPKHLTIGLSLGYGFVFNNTAPSSSVVITDENGNESLEDIPEENNTSSMEDSFGFVAQIQVIYPFSGSYAAYLTIGNGAIGVGLVLLNSTLGPFIF